jgi:diacylglycerol kinase
MLERWQRKFGCAIRGLMVGVQGQDSFSVHLPIAVLVLGLSAFLRLHLWQWCVLLLCIATVVSAELFNTAIEILVRKIHPDQDDSIGRALDIAAAAVLVMAAGAAVVGTLVLGNALWEWLTPAKLTIGNISTQP